MKTLQRILLLPLLLLAFHAVAIELDDAKAQGLVGERVDGYLGIIKEAEGVSELVDDINGKRKSKYQQLAKQNNLELAQVEALAGKKAIEKTQAGHYVLLDGEWVKK
ncbi:YdbL family protein [Lacimicrobium sp. SS2-24]|uniref:YdbL family protein n=1 Tax=Lacimicrobium sp. SS2-24 TaxID=2005569 RepID=UPI000B4B6615|nr:YdbL family protein [Lacimicrobium sp. SS2-24]